MDIYGLIGYPLTHSFSSTFFNTKFKAEGIEATYLNFEIDNVAKINSIINSHPALRGLNITIPHKESVMHLLDEVSPIAKEIGAVNVIYIDRSVNNRKTDYKLTGYNTDYIGFKNSIASLLNPNYHKRALILGTGGASKAVSKALESLGIEWMYVSRTPKERGVTYTELTTHIIKNHKIIVNTTPLGTFPHVDECPNIPFSLLTEEHLLYDLVYNPSLTTFLKHGQDRGATIKNGAEMLELQALAAWDIWNK